MTIYLDNAATSFPKPESVYQALDRFVCVQFAWASGLAIVARRVVSLV